MGHSQINLYADDTDIIVDMIYLLLSMIFRVTLMLFRPGCACVNQLLLNVSKSVMILIGTRKKMNHYVISLFISS